MMKQVLTTDLALLVLRVGTGSIMLFSHGLGKIQKFESMVDQFPDPIGLGSSTSLVMAIFAEVFCSAALILGLKTRFAVMPLLFTMLVAVLIIHVDDPFAKKELALMYAIPFLAILFGGGGKFSLDAKLPSRG